MFIRAIKPRGFTAYHFSVMLCLMHEEPPIRLSQETIGKRTGISTDKIISVIKDLKAWKWIKSRSGRRQYNVNWIEIQYANLPQPELAVALTISQRAVTLAEGYMKIYVQRCTKYKNKRGHSCTRPLRKDWKKRWETVFQLRLNEGYEYNEMAATLNKFFDPKVNPKPLVAGPQSRKLFPVKEVL